ncbi:MAG: LPS assembly lipoprotein LptE [Planctomycetaceae bacterium]
MLLRIAECGLRIDGQRGDRDGVPCRRGSRVLRLFAVCLPITLSTTGCGYTVGAPFAPEIRTVHVPAFTSNSNRRGIEYQLTEAVQKQIQQRSHFKLSKEADADTLLRGRVVDYSKRVLGQTGNSDPRQLEMNLRVEVTWEDARTGEVLRQQQIPITPEALALAAQSDLAPEIGQSLATGTNDAVSRLARNIVDMMESPW